MNIPLCEYWRLFRRYLVAQRGAALLMAVLLLVDIGLQVVGPQVVGYYIDAIQTGVSVSVLVRAALIFIVASIVQQAMHVLSEYWSERVAWTATNALRVDLVAHLLGLDPGFYEARTPGELIERVDGDVSQLADFFLQPGGPVRRQRALFDRCFGGGHPHESVAGLDLDRFHSAATAAGDVGGRV